jgi:phosphotriesterase-related protein
MQQIAKGLDFNIVVATGYYTYKDLPAYFKTHGPGLRVDMPEPLHNMFVTDIEEGIAGTGVKAAIIKIATDDYGFTPDVERVFRAAAQAHKDTGAPITTHTSAKKKGGLDQQAFLKREGVDLGHVVIGHCGDSADLDYLKAILDQGSFIGLDRFGLDNYLPAEERIATVVALCEQGYADRLTLSHDAAVYSVNTEPDVRARMFPKWRYDYVSTEVVPELMRRGVSQAQIDQMMIENPKRILIRAT